MYAYAYKWIQTHTNASFRIRAYAKGCYNDNDIDNVNENDIDNVNEYDNVNENENEQLLRVAKKERTKEKIIFCLC